MPRDYFTGDVRASLGVHFLAYIKFEGTRFFRKNEEVLLYVGVQTTVDCTGEVRILCAGEVRVFQIDAVTLIVQYPVLYFRRY